MRPAHRPARIFPQRVHGFLFPDFSPDLRLGSISKDGKDIGGFGWDHITFNHMYYGKTSQHFDTVLGSNYATEAQVKQLIYDGARYGRQGRDQSGLYKIYDVPGTNRQIRVGLYENGGIKTAYPVT
jgi:hypothetical protein